MNSKLPQQVDVRSETAVQIEVDTKRNVQYLHVDGYTAARVTGAPRVTFVINGEETKEVVPLDKTAEWMVGVIQGTKFLMGQTKTVELTGPGAEQVKQEVLAKLRSF